ncbi:hypothetical protein FOXYSP1_07387 [Fusarium oxysporum f. sp. phaseoli]
MRCHIGPHRPRDDVARPRLQDQIDPIRSPGDDTCTTHLSVWSMLSEQLQQCSWYGLYIHGQGSRVRSRGAPAAHNAAVFTVSGYVAEPTIALLGTLSQAMIGVYRVDGIEAC